MESTKDTPSLMTVHETLKFDKRLGASVHSIFRAFANAEIRSIWGTPSETATLIFDVDDFRVGGEDRFRCGSKDNPNIFGTIQYLDIVVNKRIVYVETIESEGSRLSVSLNTVELNSIGGATDLRLTVQLTSLVGNQMVEGNRIGQAAAMENLAQYVDSSLLP